MSSSEFGLPALKKLVESQNKISAVYTQPPKKSGRGLKMNKSVIHQFALQNNLCVAGDARRMVCRQAQRLIKRICME